MGFSNTSLKRERRKHGKRSFVLRSRFRLVYFEAKPVEGEGTYYLREPRGGVNNLYSFTLVASADGKVPSPGSLPHSRTASGANFKRLRLTARMEMHKYDKSA
jgi:hypothetical protein